ncbi:MAG: DUF1858 domain-containing protein [Lachnospiraceae bacterium]|nr:DUF1858 domain-containing protein [Lachnospiraceae bacterium]
MSDTATNVQQVTRETMIGELLSLDQDVAPILMGIGMHCLGCPSSQMETLEMAAMVHGIDPDSLVEEINKFLAREKTETETEKEAV